MKAITLVVFFVFTNLVLAKEIGTVVKAVGKIVRINKELKMDDLLKAGEKVYQHDEIQTARSSFVKILLTDDSIFQLGGNSKFKFEQFNGEKGKSKKAVYKLLYGKMRSLFIKQQSSKVMITTPTVSMGIRGTEVLTDVFWAKDDYKATMPKTEVALLSGKIELKIEQKEISTLILKAGEMFDSSKAMIPKLKSLSIQKMPKGLVKKLNAGKATFLFEAKKPQQDFPAQMPNGAKEGAKLPGKSIIQGRKREMHQHFIRKEPVLVPPPPPPATDATNNNDGTVTSPPPPPEY